MSSKVSFSGQNEHSSFICYLFIVFVPETESKINLNSGKGIIEHEVIKTNQLQATTQPEPQNWNSPDSLDFGVTFRQNAWEGLVILVFLHWYSLAVSKFYWLSRSVVVVNLFENISVMYDHYIIMRIEVKWLELRNVASVSFRGKQMKIKNKTCTLPWVTQVIMYWLKLSSAHVVVIM